MKINPVHCVLIAVFLFISGSGSGAFTTDESGVQNTYKTISAIACDSLVKANVKNPDFVILDVRTPSTWSADHLEGSICRDYYAADFSVRINALPKHKIYLLHCQSGNRSAQTLTLMKSLGFAVVYEMSGGISAWKSASLKTTSLTAPRLMLVSNGGTKNGKVRYGIPDTLKITLTNRANDTLRFTSFTLPQGNEFISDIDLKKKLTGAQDYTFSVFYQPQKLNRDSVRVSVKSNGGDLDLKITIDMGTVQDIPVISLDEPEIYPNPARDFISFKTASGQMISEITLFNLQGQMVKKIPDFNVTDQLDISDLSRGTYLVRIFLGNRTVVRKLVCNN